MTNMTSLLILLIFLGLLAALTVFSLKKGVSGYKAMLLGINITLFGGILAVDPNSDLGGIEYLIALLGLIITVIGFVKKD